MEELAQAAEAAYENSSEDEKKNMEKMFNSLDKNGDGIISLEEYMKYYEGYGNDPKRKEHMSNLVDRSGDGKIQFHEFLTLRYIASSGRPMCCGCDDFIKGLYFTCTSCRLESNKTRKTFDLCICCYQGKEFRHEHSEFLDNYTYLHRMSDGNGGSSTRNKATEELAEAAKAAYENYPEEEKEKIMETFRSMDRNEDKNISFEEFSKYYENYSKEILKFYRQVDRNDDGSLQFNEFLILCHILTSRRRTCDCCRELIKGLFFTCTYCRLSSDVEPDNSYDLCIPCYQGRDFKHEHDEFLDNYTFFETLTSGELQSDAEEGSTSMRSDATTTSDDSTSGTASARRRSSGSKNVKMKKAFRGLGEVLAVAVNIQKLATAIGQI